MKVIIAGSRTITDYELVKDAYFASGFKATEIISGGARGVDTLAERLAAELGIPMRVVRADWNALGRRAGILRNLEMAEIAQAAVLCWDGTSRGTEHMWRAMVELGKPVYVETLHVARR